LALLQAKLAAAELDALKAKKRSTDHLIRASCEMLLSVNLTIYILLIKFL
jgi:hypothetical protein